MLPLPAMAQTNWPSFRGANADGIARGATTPESWDVEKLKNVQWKIAIPGLGHSSPIIWGNKLFVTTAVNESKTAPLKVGLYGDPGSADDDDIQQWRILCLDKRTGKVLWEETAHAGRPKLKRHPKATHANCTMATDGKNVVAFFGSEGLFCYDLEGSLRWQKNLGILRTSPVVYNDVPDPQGIALEWGFASSPIIYSNLVFVQCDILTNGFVAALNVANGKEVWRTRRDDTATWSTPNILAEGPRPQLLVNGWKHMGGYDLRTGEEIWRMSGGGDCPVPTPVVEGFDLFHERTWAAPAALCRANRCDWRRILARRRDQQSVRFMVRLARRFLHANSVGLWRLSLQLPRRWNSLLLRSHHGEGDVQRAAWDRWGRLHGLPRGIGRQALLHQRAGRRVCDKTGCQLQRAGDQSDEGSLHGYPGDIRRDNFLPYAKSRGRRRRPGLMRYRSADFDPSVPLRIAFGCG